MTDSEFIAKEWLNRSFSSAREVEALNRRLERLMNSIAGGVANYNPSGAQIDGVSKREAAEDRLCEMSELKATIEKRLVALDKLDDETLKLINRLSDADERTIAIDRYINREKWNTISKRMHYSDREIFKIHSRLLRHVYHELTIRDGIM